MDYTNIESHHPIFPINIQQLLATVLIPKNFMIAANENPTTGTIIFNKSLRSL